MKFFKLRSHFRQCTYVLMVVLLCVLSASKINRTLPDTIILNDLQWQDHRMSTFILPGDTLAIEFLSQADVSFQAPGGRFVRETCTRMLWIAPGQSGIYPVEVLNANSSDTLFPIAAFVLIPFDSLKNGILNKYPIGAYPTNKYKKLDSYSKPMGFIEVTDENKTTQLSTHFQLQQFLCKQSSQFPQYVVIKPELLKKLELIVVNLQQNGMAISTLHMMSGYRTPIYNHAIGNVQYSRHIYGDAADIFIDLDPQDNWMDDINHDGEINLLDAERLANLIEEWSDQPAFEGLQGGLSAYPGNGVHGPFVHIDTRGFETRWGDD